SRERGAHRGGAGSHVAVPSADVVVLHEPHDSLVLLPPLLSVLRAHGSTWRDPERACRGRCTRLRRHDSADGRGGRFRSDGGVCRRSSQEQGAVVGRLVRHRAGGVRSAGGGTPCLQRCNEREPLGVRLRGPEWRECVTRLRTQWVVGYTAYSGSWPRVDAAEPRRPAPVPLRLAYTLAPVRHRRLQLVAATRMGLATRHKRRRPFARLRNLLVPRLDA